MKKSGLITPFPRSGFSEILLTPSTIKYPRESTFSKSESSLDSDKDTILSITLYALDSGCDNVNIINGTRNIKIPIK
ncbi:hypothetical protein THF1D04_40175 [Vibrio owensii]|uniref:Uncharacterized protein n=1 Tax=Vibrio owensii TaxID=696485 RepID=A0AAU9Q8K7_9VIBR|nr:hypothetical protein THF1D04_40175 [Vibrio owensii]